MKHFDLNIDKILENWDLSHAIRELIANALDESILTNTDSPTITYDDGWWSIRDFGRGLKYQDLIQSENPEKLSNPSVIGKFGIGLKDALATFERKRIHVIIRSCHGDISLTRASKHSFEDIVTLHATVAPPTYSTMTGTECCIKGVSHDDMEQAQSMFLYFTGNNSLEDTKFGSVYRRNTPKGVIYINGMKVAEESNFLFSYNITSLTASIKKALNRERQNLGRSAYSDRVRAILLNCESSEVIDALSTDLQSHSYGTSHDELGWIDVQEHAVKILNSREKVIFVSPSELIDRPDLIDAAVGGGYEVITVSDTLSERIDGIIDIEGNQVTELSEFVKQHNDSFDFLWVEPIALSQAERGVWNLKDEILCFLGGCPRNVSEIKISETMSKDPYSNRDTIGLWVSDKQQIIIKRSELRSLSSFAGTLLHEAIHAKYGVSDVSREFEHHLTLLSGSLTEKLLNSRNS